MAGIHSAHFSNAELACKHCGVNLCTKRLVDALEALRATLGRPVVIHDAYRCAVHNAAVGGARNSQHVLGKAADLSVDGIGLQALVEIAQGQQAICGIGRDDFRKYIHVDVRTQPARWCYNAAGKPVAWYPIAS